MSSFFRTVPFQADETAQHPDLIRRMRREELDAIILHGVYSPQDCATICGRLETGRHGLVKTPFPAPFRSDFLGVNLNLTAPDLTEYFAAAPVFRNNLLRLFEGLTDLQTRVTGLLSAMDQSCCYRPAPGPEQDHMFTTLRIHRPGGFIPQHFDDEQDSRGSYRYINERIVSDLFSFVLAFSQAEAGGALQVFNLRHGGERFRMRDGQDTADRLDVTGIESVEFRLAPGDMVVFNSGRWLHRVTPVVGNACRWTACSFMAQGRDGDVLCWG
jgi:hypothetical protein